VAIDDYREQGYQNQRQYGVPRIPIGAERSQTRISRVSFQICTILAVFRIGPIRKTRMPTSAITAAVAVINKLQARRQ